MTYEEAKKHINADANKYWTTTEDLAALQKVMFAIDKQIPKKPIENAVSFACSACGHELMYIKQQWCDSCGQRIDWRDNDIRRSI